MNFTREPIIETIITPKEGFKLLVRNSKGGGQEEHLVDAIEVVSFGHSFFFRSLERPKSFLVPVSDYELLEVKEARVQLKGIGSERTAIKIGGGREAPVRAPREPATETPAAEKGDAVEAEGGEERDQRTGGDQRGGRRDRGRRRRRRGGGGDERRWSERSPADKQETPSEQTHEAEEGGGARDETQVSSPMFTTLIPPPPTLISETISRYKEKDSQLFERDLPSPTVDEEKKEKKKKNDEPETGEGSSFSRNFSSPPSDFS